MNIVLKVSYIKLIVQWFEQQLNSQVKNVAKDRQDKKEYKQLAQLPDYLLRDLGIKRSDINMKLDKPFWWS